MERSRIKRLRQWAALACLAVSFFAAATDGPVAAASSLTHDSQLTAAHAALARVAVVHRKVILVVGDSLVEQAQAALESASNSYVSIKVYDRLGTAPCDWTGGLLHEALARTHPSVVVLAFAGNAGAAPGCVGASGPSVYSLQSLLSNYRIHLAELAHQASTAGAQVIISTPPARNPAVPAPPAVPTTAELRAPGPFYGFQGVPALRTLYSAIVSTSGGRWHLSNAAALAVSPGFVYTVQLGCESFDTPCPTGEVRVRTGRDDAIHLDKSGNGAKRFAAAMLSDALAPDGPTGV